MVPRYSTFEPVHTLWRQYIGDLLRGNTNKESRLLDADYHGCKLTVKQSSNPRHFGLTGYVMKDTAGAFAIISQDDRLHHVQKKGSLFQFDLNDVEQVTLIGSELLKQRV